MYGKEIREMSDNAILDAIERLIDLSALERDLGWQPKLRLEVELTS